jgi:hypothetical protein
VFGRADHVSHGGAGKNQMPCVVRTDLHQRRLASGNGDTQRQRGVADVACIERSCHRQGAGRRVPSGDGETIVGGRPQREQRVAGELDGLTTVRFDDREELAEVVVENQ